MMTNLRGALCAAVLATACVGASAPGKASAQDGELTPAEYVDIEVRARQATNEGMRARLALLGDEAGRIDSEAQFDLDALTSGRVEAVFESAGTSAGEHAAWGDRHRERIEEYLAARGDERVRIEAANADFIGLVDAIDAARAPQ